MFDINTPIATPDGWSAAGDLMVGQEVLSHIGVTTLTKRRRSVAEQGYTVMLADSGEVTCSLGQLWKLHDRPALNTSDLRAQFKKLEAKGRNRSLCIANAAPLDLPDVEGLPYDHRHVGVVVGTKRNVPVPTPYRRGSDGQRRAVLAGIMAGGGTWNPSRRRCSFITSHPQTADSIVELLVGFGFTPQLTFAAPSYRIEWTPPFNPFDDDREVEVRTPENSYLRTIVAVKAVSLGPVVGLSTGHQSVLAGPTMVPVPSP